MGRNVSITRRRTRRRASAPATRTAVSSGGNVIPKVTTEQTDIGISVKVDSNDEVLRELALQRVQKEKELEQEKELRASRRTSATQAAGLKRRSLAIAAEQRGVNIGREKSRLQRETRIKRSQVLSRSAGAGVTGTSAFKASRIALKSQLTGSKDKLNADEARNKLLDQIKGEEIDLNLQARLAENQDPVNIFLDANSGGATGVEGSTTSTTSATRRHIIQFRSTSSGGTSLTG